MPPLYNLLAPVIILGDVHKLRLQEEGGRWSKKLTFCKLSYHRKCKRRGVGGQKKPKTAYEILEHIHKKDSSAKPATIYRALDFLCTNGFAHRIETDNTYIACDGEESPHVAQFLICLKCKKAIEFHSHKATTEISKRANQEGFKITEEILEAKGFCQNCR